MLWLRCCGCIYDTASPKVPPFLPAGAAFTAIKSLTGASGTWKWRLKTLRWKRRGPSRLVDGLALKKDKNPPKQPGAAWLHCGRSTSDSVRFVTSKGPHYYPRHKKKTTSPKISFEGAALPATYIPSECFSLLHLSARLIWRTLFSRRLWPCLYFDIRRQRKPLCPLFRFHLCAFAVDLRVVLARRSMEYLLARGLLGESAAYQLGL